MPPLAVTTPSDLLADVRAGSGEALSRLFTQHAPMVYRVALRLTASSHDAEDIVQDVFIGLPQALRGYEDRGAFEAWLKRLTTRYTLMFMRGAQRRTARESTQAPAPVVDAPDEAARLTLEQAIAQLPELLRTVFVLHDIEGYGHAEIGQLLAIRAGTAQVRLVRARAQLRRLLGANA